jgi:hypothetical protein
MASDELLGYLFDGQPHLLAQPMAAWLDSSRRYAAFVNAFRDKIRKKLRTTQDQESLLDLRLELETAYLLLQESRLSLVYEPQQAERIRAPDFSVTYTTSFTFMLEVTRLRADQKSTSVGVQEQNPPTQPSNTAPAIPPLAERVAESLCSKLSQLASQRSNVLLLGVDDLSLAQSDLRAMMVRLQQRAERNEPLFLQRYRFRDRTDFFHQYQRLSEVLVRASDRQSTDQAVAWANPQARQPLPSRVRTALYRSHGIS